MSDRLIYDREGPVAFTLNASVHVREQVLDVLDFRFRHSLPKDYYPHFTSRDIEVWIDAQKRQAAHRLLAGLEKYVAVEVNEDRQYIEASISLPYVQAEHVRNLEAQRDKYQALSRQYYSDVSKLKDLVVKLHEELELERAPIYKKILRWFK